MDAMNEAIKVLRYQRETWTIMMQQLAKGKAADAAMKMEIPAPSDRMEASISMQG